jgi:flagellar assembly protein FliH
MNTKVKFTFDTDFDAANPRNEKSQVRSRKSYSAEEIDAMKHEAREEGRVDGDVRANHAIATSIGQVAAAVLAAIEAMDGEIECIRAEAAGLAIIAAKKLAHAALASAPEAEIEEALRVALHQAIGEARVVVTTSPLLSRKIQERADEIAHNEGYEGRIQFVPDDRMANADCRIEWRGGGIERAQSAIESALADLMARRFPQSDPERKE